MVCYYPGANSKSKALRFTDTSTQKPKDKLESNLKSSSVSQSYTTFVEINNIWVQFQDEKITRLNDFYEVIDKICKTPYFPILITYQKKPGSFPRLNSSVQEYINNHYLAQLDGYEITQDNKDISSHVVKSSISSIATSNNRDTGIAVKKLCGAEEPIEEEKKGTDSSYSQKQNDSLVSKPNSIYENGSVIKQNEEEVKRDSKRRKRWSKLFGNKCCF